MKVEFVKDKNSSIWYSKWNIYLDGKYSGFIYKCRKTQKNWEIFCDSLGIDVWSKERSHKTLNDAKAAVRKIAERISNG